MKLGTLGLLILVFFPNAYAVRHGITTSHPLLAKISVGDATCTGVRVHKDYILSAAHCFNKTSANRFTVKYPDGRFLITSKKYVSSVIINSDILSAELALIPLISQNEDFEAPDILTRSPSPSDFNIYGYGMNFRGNLGTLRKGIVSYKYSTIRDSFKMMIVKPGKENQHPCPGDSGGPLFEEVDGVEKLVGIVSFINHTSITFDTSRRNEDIKLEACQKANQAYYVLLSEHLDFLNLYLNLNLQQSEPETLPILPETQLISETEQ